MSAAPAAGSMRPKCFAILPALTLILLAALSLCFFPHIFAMFAFAVPTPPRFIKLAEVLRRVPYSRPSIYRKMKEGTFPMSTKLGGETGSIHGTAVWLESDIDEFMNRRIQASRSVSPDPEMEQVG